MKHLLKLADLSTEEIYGILNLADQLKYERKNNIPHPHLQGKKLGMIFSKSSTRTRVSFEVGMYELGGYALFLSDRDLQIGRGEPIKDTIRVLSRYLDGIMIRTFAQQDVEDLAKYGSIPIINGLTDYCHPCQVLADLMTIREYKGSLKGLKLCFVGDGNNMANSLIVGGIKVGMEVAIACPDNYRPDEQIVRWAKENGIHIQYNVNDLIGRALEDKRRLTDNVVVRVNQADIAEINRRFDSRKTKYVALAFLCYGKAYADRDREFSVSSAALGAWLDMSRSTLQTIYIPELVDYEYLSIIQKPQNTYSWGAKKSFHSTKYRLEVPIHNSGEFILTNNNIQKLSAEIFS